MNFVTRLGASLLTATLTVAMLVPSASAVSAEPPGQAPLRTELPSPGEYHLTHVDVGPDGILVSTEPHLLFHSTDLAHWQAVPMPINVSRILDLIWADGQWVVAAEGDRGLMVYQSADHKAWTGTPISRDVPKGPTSLSVAGGKVWVANDAGLWEAPLGTSLWAPVPTPAGFYPRALASGGGNLVLVGRREGGGGAILRSALGGSWQEVAQTAETLQTVAYEGGQFLAGGAAEPNPVGTLWRSTDGLTWEPWASLAVEALKAAPDFGFIALQRTSGPRRGALWSRDGQHWTEGHGGPYHFYDATWVSGRVLLVGSSPGLTVAFGPFCAPYIDLAAGDTSCAPVAQLTASGLFRGYPGQQFRPTEQLTRGQLAALLVRYKGLEVIVGGPWNPDWSINEGWFQTALSHQLLQPGSDGTWRPWEPLTRGELLKTVMQAAGIAPLPNADPGYADVLITDPTLAPWVAGARQAKLIGPEAPNPLWTGPSLGPTLLANRAETALLFANLPH